MAIIPDTITKKSFWSDEEKTYEVHELVQLEANGGTTIDGEWEFSGSYSISVPTGQIGNSYNYTGSLYPKYAKRKPDAPYWRGKRNGWNVYLSVTSNSSNRSSINILNKNTTSKKKARQMVVEAIREFEQTDRYQKEMWPEISHPDYREPIIKDIKGELYWIATTWVGAWSALQGKAGFYADEKPMGYGQFYTRKVNKETEYPIKEDGSKDWDNGVKVYKTPSYVSYEIRGGSMGSGGKLPDDLKQRIDEAIWNLDNMLAEYIQRQRFSKI